MFRMQNITGYRFFDRAWASSPGYIQLDVMLGDREHTFRPEVLHLPVVTDDHQMECKALEHPHADEIIRVGPGLMTIHGETGEAVQAFSFGGKVRLQSHGDTTLATVSSEAPVLDLSDPYSVGALLAQKIEHLFAEYRVECERRYVDFEAQITSVSPLHVYAGCLIEIRNHLGRAALTDPGDVRLLKEVATEIDILRMQPRFRDVLPTLSGLLSLR